MDSFFYHCEWFLKIFRGLAVSEPFYYLIWLENSKPPVLFKFFYLVENLDKVGVVVELDEAERGLRVWLW